MKFLEVWQHGNRIFRAEANSIYDIRIQPVTGHLVRIKRIPHQYKPLFYTIDKPFGIKSGNIGPLSCIDYHGQVP